MTTRDVPTRGDRLRLGRAIEARRAVLDLSQKQVVPHGMTYQNLMRGDTVSPKTLRRVENALGWATGSADDVLAGGEPALREHQPSGADVRYAFEDAAGVFDGIAGATDEERAIILELLERGRRRIAEQRARQAHRDKNNE